MTADKDGTLVENARNYITFNINGDLTDYEEYKPKDGKAHTTFCK